MRNLLLISALLILALAQSAQPEYNETANFQQLQKRYDRYVADIDKLSKAASDLQTKLNQTKDNTSIQISSLQETMAEERDILTNIESYLRLPFNISRCDCYKLTEEQRSKLLQSANKINESLATLQSKIALDPQCPKKKQISLQINREKLYIQSVTDAIRSDCCKRSVTINTTDKPTGVVDISGHEVITNLNAGDWTYGGLTPADVRLWYFSKVSQSNVTRCPLDTPFASKDGCIRCNKTLPIWDLRKSECIKCPTGTLFNSTGKVCSEDPNAVKPSKNETKINNGKTGGDNGTTNGSGTTTVTTLEEIEEVVEPLTEAETVVDPIVEAPHSTVVTTTYVTYEPVQPIVGASKKSKKHMAIGH